MAALFELQYVAAIIHPISHISHTSHPHPRQPRTARPRIRLRNPRLEVTLVPEPALRKATLSVFYDMMQCEQVGCWYFIVSTMGN